MPTISYDGQSFSIDGRRIWLVSGSIHFSRVPKALWRSRIRAARQAGLNCIDTYCFWNLHEPAPGVFNFDEEADLRSFVKLIAEEGMYCILRPGPYVCAEWDFGGLPPWLLKIEGIKLREANGPFLEATSRYLGAIMEQVRDLQVTSPVPSPTKADPTPRPIGPILMIQAENEWISHNPAQADTYLREIVRYLRENGCEAPINVCNNLWQRVDGTIDTWNANQHLAADTRQLRVVQPQAPRLVTEFWPGWFDQWGRPHSRENTAPWNEYRLAQMLAVGTQYNLYMFHGGTNFGFYAGRTIARPDCFMTTSYDYDAPLREAGGRGDKYHAVKRVSVFASQFAQLFAHLDPDHQHCAVAPLDDDHPASILHQTGSQGDVVFVLGGNPDAKANKPGADKPVNVLLPNGLTLPVWLGEDRAAWFVLRANLGGAATLDYTNLRPWAFLARKLLVLFGPAGSTAHISLNGAAWQVAVPTGHDPLVETHDEITLVVLNREQVDAAYTNTDRLFIGAAGLDGNDAPLPLEGWPATLVVHADGKVEHIRHKPAKRPAPPRLGEFRMAEVTTYLDGSGDAFKPIDGPASFESLGNDFGYGWYRLQLKSNKSATALAPRSGDRLHFFADGKPGAILGLGPGASYEPTKVSLGQTNVVLADNLGRFNFGWLVGENKGLFGHVYQSKPIALGAPKVVAGQSPDPFAMHGFVLYTRRGESQPADALVWKFKANAKRPVVLDVQSLPGRAMIFLNEEPVALYDRHFCAWTLRLLLDEKSGLRTGTNELRFALFTKHDPKVKPQSHVRLFEATANLTADAQWAFAPFAVPPIEAFNKPAKPARGPAWYLARFNTPDGVPAPLFLEANGLSKGQLYLNGRNLGRYFVNTADGKPVPPQLRYYLPEPWLHTAAPNELLFFDEHGKTPAKCRLVFDEMGPYGI